MNCGMIKALHRYVIAHSNVLFSHSLLEPFLGKIFILYLGGLDRVVLGGLDKSKSKICTNGCLVGVGWMTKPGLTIPDLDNLCLDLLWP